MRPVAWITGAGGLIGSYITRAAPTNYNARALTRDELELTDFAATARAFRHEEPQLVIHCAAMSRTPACEKNPELARKNNVEVTRVLCELARDIPLLFFSTDLVFDGAKGNYREGDSPNPLMVYARTKLAAERFALENPRHTVIRTSLNVGRTPRRTSFNEQWTDAWRRGESLKLFADEFRSPIAAELTARAVWELLAAERTGLYHLGGSERLSRFEIGALLAANEPPLIAPIERSSIRDYPDMHRPADTSLDSARIQQLLSFPLPKFSDWLNENGASLKT